MTGAPQAPGAPASVRGRLLVLTGGRRGTPEDSIALAAALLLDAALEGAVSVEAHRRLGFDRRRVVPGSGPVDGCTAPLIAEVRRRVLAAAGDTPWGWCERLAVFAEDAAADELIAAGLVRALPVSWWKRVVRHRTLQPVDPTAAEAVRSSLAAIAAGRSATQADIALAAALHGCDVIEGTLRGRDARRLDGALEAATRSLPDAARAIAEALRDRRRRTDSIGTWYADD